MTYSTAEIWFLIVGLGFGSFLLRFSFLGVIGGRDLPDWFERHLKYVGVAVMPAIVAPLVMWPEATDGAFDLPRVSAALVAFALGIWKKSVLWSVAGGLATLYLGLFLAG